MSIKRGDSVEILVGSQKGKVGIVEFTEISKRKTSLRVKVGNWEASYQSHEVRAIGDTMLKPGDDVLVYFDATLKEIAHDKAIVLMKWGELLELPLTSIQAKSP